MTKVLGTLIAIVALLTGILAADAAQQKTDRSFTRTTVKQRSMLSTSHSVTRSERIRKARVSSDKTKTSVSRSRSRNSDATKRTNDSIKKDSVPKDSSVGGRDIKSSSSAAREAKTPITFDRKPADVAHNPEHLEGNTGDRADHKSVLVERDGHYFKRSYYSGLGAGVLTWYWYDTPLADSDPIIPVLPYVATCAAGNDDCRITARKSSDPNRLTNPDPVIGGFWWWWDEPYGPVVKVSPRCDPVVRTVPGSMPAVAIYSCANVAGSCSGTCQLYDGAGALVGGSPPATVTGSPAPAASVVTCKCP